MPQNFHISDKLDPSFPIQNTQKKNHMPNRQTDQLQTQTTLKNHAEQDIKMKVTSKKKQWSIDVNLSCHIKCVPYLQKKILFLLLLK